MSMTILVLFAIFCKAVPAAGSSNVLHRRSCPASPNSNYTVLANNTCQTIAEAYSVSTDYIIALNCLDPTGSDLKANTSILLPGCCTTYLVKQGDTCGSIASSTVNLTLADFFSFNRMINTDCSNLIAGRNICLDAPQGTPFNAPPCSAQSNASSTSASASPVSSP